MSRPRLLSAVSQAWPDLVSALRSPISRNAAALTIQQVSTYLLPLITVPYLVRILGAFGYGVVAFAQSLTGYFLIVIDFGFAYSATRRISQSQDNPNTTSRIASAVWTVKIMLWLVCFAIMAALVFAIPKLREWGTLFVIFYSSLLGNALFPSWLFQGLERLGPAVVIGLTGRVLSILAMFLVVRTAEDYTAYAILMSVTGILIGIGAAAFAVRRFNIQFVLPSREEIRGALRDGWTLFLSNAAVGLYTVGNSFILGLLSTPAVVGHYYAAERIVRTAVQFPTPLSQAMFPVLSKVVAVSKRRTLILGRRLLFVMGGVGLLLSCVVFFGAPWIAQALFGPEFQGSVLPMRIMAALPLLIGVSNVLGVQTMLPFGRDRAFTGILFAAGALNVALAVLLVPVWQQAGMATAVLLSELAVTLAMFAYLQRARISPLQPDVSARTQGDPGLNVNP